jgi:hypothetical protein
MRWTPHCHCERPIPESKVNAGTTIMRPFPTSEPSKPAVQEIRKTVRG